MARVLPITVAMVIFLHCAQSHEHLTNNVLEKVPYLDLKNLTMLFLLEYRLSFTISNRKVLFDPTIMKPTVSLTLHVF